MLIKNDQLKKFLLDSNLVSERDYLAAEKTARESEKTVKEALIDAGKLSNDQFRHVEAYILGIPFCSLLGEKIDFDILSLIPEPIAKNHNIIAYKKKGNDLEVAMLDTDDLEVLDFIKKKSGLRILPRLTDEASIKSALNQYKKTLKAEFDDIIQKESASLKTVAEDSGETDEATLKEMAEDLPIIKIDDTLISHAILQGASDDTSQGCDSWHHCPHQGAFQSQAR